jgi:hypothetical protein
MPRCVVEDLAWLMMTEAAKACRQQDQQVTRSEIMWARERS